jgi:hypothetical protein
VVEKLLASAAFLGSGWLLTLVGTAAAFLTFWHVGRKNSAFRRALLSTSRRELAAGLMVGSDELVDLAQKLGSVRTRSARVDVAMEWAAAAGRLRAVVDAQASSNPLAVGTRDFGEWETGAGQRFGASLRGRSKALPALGNSINAALDLSNELDASTQVALAVLGDASEENFAKLRSNAGAVIDKMAYVARRTQLARNGDLHDDR